MYLATSCLACVLVANISNHNAQLQNNLTYFCSNDHSSCDYSDQISINSHSLACRVITWANQMNEKKKEKIRHIKGVFVCMLN